MAKPFISAKVVKKVDPKKIAELAARMAGLGQVLVGVPNSEIARDDGTFNNADVAATMEYGTTDGKIPERPFLRNTIRANLDYYRRLNRVNVVRVMRGEMSPQQALEQLGAAAVGHVQAFIYSNDYQLADSTIAAKGSSRALVDSAQLVQSINYEIAEGTYD